MIKAMSAMVFGVAVLGACPWNSAGQSPRPLMVEVSAGRTFARSDGLYRSANHNTVVIGSVLAGMRVHTPSRGGVVAAFAFDTPLSDVYDDLVCGQAPTETAFGRFLCSSPRLRWADGRHRRAGCGC